MAAVTLMVHNTIVCMALVRALYRHLDLGLQVLGLQLQMDHSLPWLAAKALVLSMLLLITPVLPLETFMHPMAILSQDRMGGRCTGILSLGKHTITTAIPMQLSGTDLRSGL